MYAFRILTTLLAAAGSTLRKNNGEQQQKTNDPIADWKPPSNNEIQQIRRLFVEPMKSLSSPIFFSTDSATGKRHQSLKYVQQSADNRPILFISNHQLVGIDSWLVVNELWEKSNIFVRAMTHPFISADVKNDGTDGAEGEGAFTLPGSQSLYKNFGCLPVSPRNYYKLMKYNQPTLLFPGGARESFHKVNEQYTLKGWSETSDFVRIAAKYNATIMPISSVGAAESAIFLDNLPFADTLNDALVKATPNGGAPYDARYDANKEPINFPLVLPKPTGPARHYFLFNKPINLENIDYKDKDECQQIYNTIQDTIKQGCNDLLEAKTKDPFDNPIRRIPYEQFWRKDAPTFSIDVLNNRKISKCDNHQG